jgi:hypothetical protein
LLRKTSFALKRIAALFGNINVHSHDSSAKRITNLFI